VRLDGKVIIVTGAAQGLGRAFSVFLAGEGASVMAVDVADCRATTEEIDASRGSATGPVRFLVPLRGWSNVDKPGSVLYHPEEDRVFFEELRACLTAKVPIEEVDCDLEDYDFACALAGSFDEMFKSSTRKKVPG